jgi:hypothetical protein
LIAPVAPEDPTHDAILGRTDSLGILKSLWIWSANTQTWSQLLVGSAVDSDSEQFEAGWLGKHNSLHVPAYTCPAGVVTFTGASTDYPSTFSIDFEVVDQNDSVVATGTMPANTTYATDIALVLTAPFFVPVIGSTYAVRPVGVVEINGYWRSASAPATGLGFRLYGKVTLA